MSGDNDERTWSAIVRLGWGPGYAAANVIKHLRGTKDDSRAGWYWERLIERTNDIDWLNELNALSNELTQDELARLRK